MPILRTVWTILCTALGGWFLSGELVTLHLLLALGTLITGTTFQEARRLVTGDDRTAPRTATTSGAPEPSAGRSTACQAAAPRSAAVFLAASHRRRMNALALAMRWSSKQTKMM